MDYEKRDSGTSYGEALALMQDWSATPSEEEEATRSIRLGDMTVDFQQRRVAFREKSVPLTYIEWLLLAELVRNAGQMVSYEKLLTRVWGPEHSNNVHLLRIWISRLRYKLEDSGTGHRFVRTVRKSGYAIGKSED
ncbi:MAG: response regulator transcription factor [Chloroflexi bacterium]|nr:response regulator transcription factor [Chloroflexota bacterium]